MLDPRIISPYIYDHLSYSEHKDEFLWHSEPVLLLFIYLFLNLPFPATKLIWWFVEGCFLLSFFLNVWIFFLPLLFFYYYYHFFLLGSRGRLGGGGGGVGFRPVGFLFFLYCMCYNAMMFGHHIIVSSVGDYKLSFLFGFLGKSTCRNGLRRMRVAPCWRLCTRLWTRWVY